MFRNTKNAAKLAAVATMSLIALGGSTLQARAESANDIIAKWPADARKAAMGAIKGHGQPDEMTTTRLIWHNSGPWKRLVAERTPFLHKFPIAHPDSYAGVIDYKVPANMLDDLARFDGSVIVERTKGEMSARCDADTHNTMSLNLAHDIITGKRSVANARAFYGRVVKMEMEGKGLHPYMLRFNFPTHRAGTEYPDKVTIKIKK